MAETDAQAREVVAFWKEAGPDRWFSRDDAFDAKFRERFHDLHFAAARRELDGWAVSAEGALALLILLDQFPRNCFRGSGHMFATDSLARSVARKAVDDGFDRQVETALRSFFYLPFMHSENLADQQHCVELCTTLDGNTQKFAREHRDIIEKFGRFPHRNPAMGRDTTADEQAYLDGGGFSG